SASIWSGESFIAFIAGVRVVLVLARMPSGSVNHCRTCSALFFAAMLTSGPFGLPLPETEWHIVHFCAVNNAAPCCAFALCANAGGTAASRNAANAKTVTGFIAHPPCRTGEQGPRQRDFREFQRASGALPAFRQPIAWCPDLPLCPRLNADPRVHDPAAVARRHREHRIQIELGDLGHVDREPRDAQQQVAQRVEIGRLVAAVAFEQRQPLISWSSSSASRSVSGPTRNRTSPRISTWMPPKPN